MLTKVKLIVYYHMVMRHSVLAGTGVFFLLLLLLLFFYINPPIF